MAQPIPQPGQFHYLRPRNPSIAAGSFAPSAGQSVPSQAGSLTSLRPFGLDSPGAPDEDEEDGRTLTAVMRPYPSAALDDLDSPLDSSEVALDVPSFPTGDDDGDADGDGPAAAGQVDSDHSGGWSESTSDSDESVSASDGWYGGHGRASTNSSVASRMVNLDEEISLHEHHTEQVRHAAKQEERRRQKKMQEQNAGMPCPPMCGVSWGIHGELVYFSNLPLLTHYLVTNQRRRQKPLQVATDQGGFARGGSGGEERNDVQRLMSDPTAHIDHEEEENSAWAGANAAAHAAAQSAGNLAASPVPLVSPYGSPAPLPSPSFSSSVPLTSAHIDVDEVLPRTYQDLLALPFVAAHLGYVVGEDMEEKPESELGESETATPFISPTPPRRTVSMGKLSSFISSSSSGSGGMREQSSDGSGASGRMKRFGSSDNLLHQRGGIGGVSGGVLRDIHSGGGGKALLANFDGTTPTAIPAPSSAPAHLLSSSHSADQIASLLPSPPQQQSPSQPQQQQQPPQEPVLDLASVDLDSVVLPGVPGSASSTLTFGQAAAARAALKVSLSSASLLANEKNELTSGLGSGHQLDQLGGADTYDILDEYDVDMINQSNGFSASSMMAAGGGGGGLDASSSTINSGALAEDFFSQFYNSTIQLGVSAVGALVGGKASGPAAAASGRPHAPMVPPLPSTLNNTASALAAAGGGGGASGGGTGLSGVGGVSKKTSSSNSLAGSSVLTPRSSIGRALNEAGADGGSAAATGEKGIKEDGGGDEHDEHSWVALSTSVPPAALDPTFTRKRIRINTSVLIMSCEEVLPCSSLLASTYSLSGPDSVSICLANYQLCQSLGREDLAEMWQLAAIVARPSPQGETTGAAGEASLTPWNEHPMGGRLAEQLIQHYLRSGDIQTVAMLVSVFSFRSPTDTAAAPMLPSRPPPTLVEVHELEGCPLIAPGADAAPMPMAGSTATRMIRIGSATGLTPANSTESLARSLHTFGGLHPSDVPLPASARDSPTPSPAGTMTPSSAYAAHSSSSQHPMALLPSTVDGSSRTWGPGSKTPAAYQKTSAASNPMIVARGFDRAREAIRSNYSSGTASPNDTIYNSNASQRARWRGAATGASGLTPEDSSALSRARAGSFTQSARPKDIPRIEEGGGAGGLGREGSPEAGASVPILPSTDADVATTRHTISDTAADGSSTGAPSMLGLTPSTSQPTMALTFAPPIVYQIRLDALDLYLHLYAEYLYRLQLYSSRSKLLKFLTLPQAEVQHVLTGFPVEEQVYGVQAVCQWCGKEQEGRGQAATTTTMSLVQTTGDRNLVLAPKPTLKQQPSSGSDLVALSRSTTPSSTMSPPPFDSSALVSPRCSACHHFPLSCAICQVAVKGIYLMCVLCGHGGHPAHLTEWFRSGNTECPTACGCRCEVDGGLQGRPAEGANQSGAGGGAKSKLTRRKKKEMRALENEQRQAAVEAQLADADEEQQADDAEHAENVQHFWNPSKA